MNATQMGYVVETLIDNLGMWGLVYGLIFGMMGFIAYVLYTLLKYYLEHKKPIRVRRKK